MSRSVIVSAVRTPFGKLNGGLAAYPATELGAIAIRAGLERVGLEGREVDYVIMGQVLQAGAGPAPARAAGGGGGGPHGAPRGTGDKGWASPIRAGGGGGCASARAGGGRHARRATGGAANGA